MARDYLTLGPTPCDEPCTPAGDNPQQERKECLEYIKQLQRTFPTWEQDNIYFRTKSFPHDFGSYTEVVVWFDADDEKSCQAAYKIESNLPENWDEHAVGVS